MQYQRTKNTWNDRHSRREMITRTRTVIHKGLKIMSLSMYDLQAFINHCSSFSDHFSSMMSVIPGKSSWFFDIACYNHMTSDPTLFVSNISTSHISAIYTAVILPCQLPMLAMFLHLNYLFQILFLSFKLA